MNKQFTHHGVRFEPEHVNYNGRPATIWDVWQYSLAHRAWVHKTKISTARKATKAQIIEAASL